VGYFVFFLFFSFFFFFFFFVCVFSEERVKGNSQLKKDINALAGVDDIFDLDDSRLKERRRRRKLLLFVSNNN
jgi:hypothetical protein